MARGNQTLRRVVSVVLQRRTGSEIIPRTGNALTQASFQGNISRGGPPKVNVSPFMQKIAVRHYPCASSLGLPPPDKVVVQYNPANTDDFIALADEIEAERGDLIVDGVESDIPTGSFVVMTENGVVLEEGSLREITAAKVLELVEQPSDQPRQAVAGRDCVI